LNAGAQGYDTVAEAAFLAGPGIALCPQGVVVGMSFNDYDPATAYALPPRLGIRETSR
jgi:hypothetical protein